MQILSLTLTNFKSYSDCHFEFQRGTNAICGENGAGKTSILEAIAWVLFDHSDYVKADLIRRGQTSAQVAVSLLSGKDGRVYEVRRCTQNGYKIYDPELKATLDLRKVDEEVLPWLQEHLGLNSNIGLAELFASTIGIPQGTFTADFLKRPNDRRKVFDPILKVEEYKQAYEKTNPLRKYIEDQVADLERAIAQYDEVLQDWESLRESHSGLQQAILQDEAVLKACDQELAALQAQKAELKAQSEKIRQLADQQQQLTAQIEGKNQTNQLLKLSLERSQQAAAICQANQSGYQTFLAAEASLQALEQDQRQRQQLWQEREAEQRSLDQSEIQLKVLTTQQEELRQRQQELDALKPLVDQQRTLEEQREAIAQALQACQRDILEQTSAQQQILRLKTDLAQVEAELERLQSLQGLVDQIPALEQQCQDWQSQLGRLGAAQQFTADLQRIVAAATGQRQTQSEAIAQAATGLEEISQALPLFSGPVETAIATLHGTLALHGQLVTEVQSILTDLTAQTDVSRLEQQLQDAQAQLAIAYQHQAAYGGRSALETKHADILAELTALQQRLKFLQHQLEQQPDLEQRQTQIAQDLAALANPQARSQILRQSLQQQPALTEKIQAIHQEQDQIQQRLQKLQQQLDVFVDLEQQLALQQQQRQAHQLAYQSYLQHEQDARSVAELSQKLAAAEAELVSLTQGRSRAQETWEALVAAYDPAQLAMVEQSFQSVQSRKDQLVGGLPEKRKELQRLERELAERAAIATQRDIAQAELGRQQQVRQFIADAREFYRQAGPRITEFYLAEISREADRLFRELLNRPNVALEWTEDYEIRVQEGGHWRGFRSLSGGEQMCAALAVRLALMKVLAEVDIAFFDEPTTNMDRARRQQLAEAIGNLRSFQQIFVISHDDTFESITENIIRVDRSE